MDDEWNFEEKRECLLKIIHSLEETINDLVKEIKNKDDEIETAKTEEMTLKEGNKKLKGENEKLKDRIQTIEKEHAQQNMNTQLMNQFISRMKDEWNEFKMRNNRYEYQNNIDGSEWKNDNDQDNKIFDLSQQKMCNKSEKI